MKIKTYIAPLGLFLLLLSSCKKDTDVIIFDAVQGLDTNWYSNYNTGMKAVQLKNELQEDYAFDTISINSILPQIICNNFLSISFPYSSIVDFNGYPYHGQAIIKSKLLIKNGSSIKMLKSASDNDKKFLQSLASFFIAIYDMNNEELYIDSTKNITVGFHYDNPPFYPNSTNLYFGNETSLLSFNWNQAQYNNLNFISSSSDNVYINFNVLGWISCSKIYSSSQTTKVSVNLPYNYTNANTIAYLSFEDKKIALQFDPNTSAKQFQSISVPVGLRARIVIISKQGNNYFKGISSDFVTSSISATGGFQSFTITPTITTLNSITNYLDSL